MLLYWLYTIWTWNRYITKIIKFNIKVFMVHKLRNFCSKMGISVLKVAYPFDCLSNSENVRTGLSPRIGTYVHVATPLSFSLFLPFPPVSTLSSCFTSLRERKRSRGFGWREGGVNSCSPLSSPLYPIPLSVWDALSYREGEWVCVYVSVWEKERERVR